MLKLHFIDDQYPQAEITHIRKIARAIVLDENNNIIILQIKRNDIFGNYSYLETPGGGVEENETISHAVKRELEEEIGTKVKIIKKIGIVGDYYNLLNRQNENHYFLVKVVSKTKIHHESFGDSFISNILNIPLDEVIKIYEEENNIDIIKLVKQRELPILLEAKRIITNLIK
ncbi:MAG: NUDIX hydrolase [Erysipelotrichales bacterium]|nr:NUDIX hydrolase [Erysipelotrichales bacterium]